jgi:hypothetical protein
MIPCSPWKRHLQMAFPELASEIPIEQVHYRQFCRIAWFWTPEHFPFVINLFLFLLNWFVIVSSSFSCLTAIQTQVVHEGTTCRSCSVSPIQGYRFSSLVYLLFIFCST